MKIMGIDYGDVRIGLALSDREGRLARRFMTLKNTSLENTILEIIRLTADEMVEKIIIGLPVGLKMESEQTRKTNDFIFQLKEKIKVPIVVLNEVFTSKIAKENLLNSGIKGKQLKEVIDQEAARIILQEYLDKMDSNER
jgi:putative holliday junction resolvase